MRARDEMEKRRLLTALRPRNSFVTWIENCCGIEAGIYEAAPRLNLKKRKGRSVRDLDTTNGRILRRPMARSLTMIVQARRARKLLLPSS